MATSGPTVPTTDVSGLRGRTAVVTGASSGIGLATARVLGAAGARVVLAVRDLEKGRRAAATVPGEAVVAHLDLADLGSVRAFADGWREPVDLLVNNAGVSSPTLQRTREGVELQFATNHLGHFALTNLLLPRVAGRVVSLSSQAERAGRLPLDDLGWERRRYTESRAYAASKLATLVFTAELQRRLSAAGSPVLATAAHPGYVATGMTGQGTGALARLLLRLAQASEDGALPVLLAATGDVPGGAFTGPERLLHMRGGAQLIGRSRRAQDPALARRLWEVSERASGTSFPL
ncbi:SDR family NAD(P)-dependent oxidoreductase [Streptomyces sp. NP160]|uniref:oxidoreductase n=1 Tax=Streptomyces sp. NP160 TaxID=2586637 RepID=UPI0011185A41|nr:oxidoreductase [Streptomyces sp. NP160]TNM64114.1 SDR family NAD(P)-dependent oxidoreductase [Streptomyces sp. NP160]